MARLFIAEKPSLAKAIASGLGKGEHKKDYIEVGNDIVTWCFGHLLELASPGEYDARWSKWDINTLPICPSQWKLKPRSGKGPSGSKAKKDDDGAQRQIKVIESLLKKASVVVNAGDPDREGQLLVDEVLEYLGWNGKTQRLLLNATDPASVKKAIASIKDNATFRPLYESALCRQRADWLVGMNLTVAATKTFGKDKLVSIGRVQTPTLALVVNRDKEIEAFKPINYYYMVAKVDTGCGVVEMAFNPKDDTDRIKDKKLAEKIAGEIKGKTFEVKVEKQTKTERPPLPYMLATFQKDAEEKLKLGANQSLSVLQQLYEGRLSSYPRTERELLPPEQKGYALKIAQTITGAGFVREASGLASLMSPSDRIYSLPQDAEHHGIVPTGQILKPDTPDLLIKAWEMIARRFIAGLLPDYKYEQTTISFQHDKYTFSASGEVPLNKEKSWVALYGREAKALPLKCEPKTGKILDVEVKSGKTTPPKPYTEASLITDMISISKYVSDPKIKAKLKETSGIGTPATRASIIETLKSRGYIETKGKTLRATEMGRHIIESCPKAVTDPGTTALWEEALSQIAESKYLPGDFMDRIMRYVNNQIDSIKCKQKNTPSA